jgi:hypothetical protein
MSDEGVGHACGSGMVPATAGCGVGVVAARHLVQAPTALRSAEKLRSALFGRESVLGRQLKSAADLTP